MGTLAAIVCVVTTLGVWRPTGWPGSTVERIAPPAAAAGAEEQGRLVYRRYGCGMCHGPDGAGGFANLNAETDGEVPAVVYVAEGYSEDELHRLIRNGTPPIGKADPDGPQPPFLMPGWGERMSDADAEALVAYLFSLYPEEAAESWR